MSGNWCICTTPLVFLPAGRRSVGRLAAGMGRSPVLDFVAEVKARANGEGFKQREAWLGEHDLLLLRRDRQRPLVVLPWEVYIQRMQGYQAQRTHDDAPPMHDL